MSPTQDTPLSDVPDASGVPGVPDLPDLSGRTAVVTGASSGIGLATADALARAGAHVVLAVRDPRRGREAAARTAGGGARSTAGSTEVRPLDLADLASVREFAAGLTGPVDLLINNAGVMMVPEGRTKDGFETQFGTNHLGHFALTNLLLPRVTDRVVTVSSEAHRWTDGLGPDSPHSPASYDPRRAYARSKLANLLFTLELQRRLTASGSRVRALAAHPGLASTGLTAHAANPVVRTGMRLATMLLGQDSRSGALPTLFAATRDLPGASYVGPGGPGGRRGAPALAGRSAAAGDPVAARRLWAVSEELTGVRYPLVAAV
ncbi:oxidoreductase [Streptomyces sp. NPDC047000]|uniref:oxidoreductase n=1 Tax=Streptomyces sp. NPDC047000 TaxID=3155474 RepID=UPI0033E8B4F7